MSYQYKSDCPTNFRACNNGKRLCNDPQCYRCQCIHEQLNEQRRINEEMRRLSDASDVRIKRTKAPKLN